MPPSHAETPTKAPKADIAQQAVNVVLDTNCWLDLLVFADPSVGRLRDALECRSIIAVSCAPMREEFLRVISRPRINKRCAAQMVVFHYDRLSSMRALPPSQRLRLACSDPDDQIFLDLAIEEGALALISKDRQLRRLAKKSRFQFQLEILSQDSAQFQAFLSAWTPVCPAPVRLGDAQ
jgi:putative PIN family toxin of toxin-antitoxin system